MVEERGVLNNDLKIDKELQPKLFDLNENISGQNIHFSYTDNFYELNPAVNYRSLNKGVKIN